MHPDKSFMQEAILIARMGKSAGESPIGAVVVIDGEIISTEHTSLQTHNDPSAHAEMLALRAAAKKMKSRYLEGAVLYTTLEPCPMCTSAAIWAKCEMIVYGAKQEDAIEADQDPQSPTSFRQIRIKAKYIVERGTPIIEIAESFMRAECLQLLSN